MSARNISADNELLTEVDAVLRPSSGPFAGLIYTVGPFGDDALKAVRLDKLQHLRCSLMGPAKDPSMDALFLLSPNARLAKQITQVRQATAVSKGLPYRMTEGNSCFGGGKPGVSNAYASALWGADYLLTCASAGFAGVNLHGGGDGFYTPIAVGPGLATEMRPLYYGMQLADQFSGFEMYECRIDQDRNVTTYFGRRGKRMLLALNKDQKDIVVDLPAPLLHHKVKTEMRLTGPSLNALAGTNLIERTSSVRKSVMVPAYSAALLKW